MFLSNLKYEFYIRQAFYIFIGFENLENKIFKMLERLPKNYISEAPFSIKPFETRLLEFKNTDNKIPRPIILFEVTTMNHIKRLWGHYIALLLLIAALSYPIYRIYKFFQIQFGQKVALIALSLTVIIDPKPFLGKFHKHRNGL